MLQAGSCRGRRGGRCLAFKVKPLTDAVRPLLERPPRIPGLAGRMLAGGLGPRTLFPRDLGLALGGAGRGRASPGEARRHVGKAVATCRRRPVKLRSGREN